MNKKYELAVNLQQDFTAEEQAQGRANIGAVSAADVELAILSYASLAANTLRFSFSKLDYDPTVAGVGSDGTWKKVGAKFNNVWDWTSSGNSFNNAFSGAFSSIDNLVSVIAAGDTSAVTGMNSMFEDCSSLTSVPLFDTSAVTDMFCMFLGCSSLTSVPLFDTSAVEDMSSTFNGCTKVEGGALALYQRASTQATPPINHFNCFNECGKANIDGYCELCKVPVAWGGTQALVIEKSQGGTYEATLPGAYTVAGDSVFMPYELDVQHVVYDRSFAKSVRSTMWLPFDLNIGAFTDDFDFRIISLDVRDGTVKVIYSAPPASGIIPKNTPISIKRKEQSSTERLEFGTGTFTISTQPTNVPEPIVFEGYEYQPVLAHEYTVFEAATDDLKYYGLKVQDGQLALIDEGAFIHPYKVVIRCSKIEE